MSTNDFDKDKLARYYDEQEICVHCGEYSADCFDHVIPRANKYANSLLNASPTHNHKCNIAKHGKMHTFDNQVKMLFKNMLRLRREGYKITELDNDFILEYAQAQEALKLL